MGKFLVGVGTARMYDTSENLLFESKTMLDTAIEVSTDSTPINGGQGNALLYIYFHTPELTINLTETQWNLGMVAANVGSSIETNNDVWDDEEVTLGAGGAGSVLGTPLVTPDGDTTIYGWVSFGDATEKVAFTGQNFTTTIASENDIVCVRFYKNDSASRKVEINANFVPSNGRLVIDAQLASSTDGTIQGSSIIGKVQFEIDRAQLSGAQTIEMSSSGVSNTPLSAMALANTANVSGCSGAGVYGRIVEIISDANWYDNVIALAIEGGDFDLTHPDTSTLRVLAIPREGQAFTPPYADLTFDSSDVGAATIDADGLVTTVAAGTTLLSATITAKPTIEASATLTVS